MAPPPTCLTDGSWTNAACCACALCVLATGFYSKSSCRNNRRSVGRAAVLQQSCSERFTCRRLARFDSSCMSGPTAVCRSAPARPALASFLSHFLFPCPSQRQDEADATVADQGMRLQTVETVKIAIHATEADAARPFLVWWDPEADILKYSAAQTSIILSKAPATVSDTANVRERYTVLRPGQRRGAAGTVIASATTSPAQPSSAGRSTDRTATGRTQGGSSSDESSDSD